jgi:hypothetical protein
MSSPTVAPPPPSEAPPETPQPKPEIPVHAPLRRFGRSARSGRPSAGALAGSVVVHVGLLVLAVAFIRFGPEFLERRETEETVEYFDLAFPEPVAGPRTASAEGGEGVSFPAPAAPETEAPRDAERPPRGEAGEALSFPTGTPSGIPEAGGEPAAVGTGTGAGGQPGGTGTGGSPLSPGIRDPRLFPTQRPVPAEPEQTDHEKYMGRLGATLGEYNDSVAAEGQRARDALDWTVKDKNGNAWGFSPGKIHLGKVTLPAPGATASPEHREEAERRARQRIEIDRQIADGERRHSFQERVKATRERRDAERRAARGES